MLKDLAGCLFAVLEVGSHTGTGTEGLRRRVNANKDNVARPDAGLDVGAEKEISPPDFPDQFVKAGFVDGETIGIPGGYARRVDIHHRHPVVGALGSDHGHGGPTNVTGADAENVFIHVTLSLHNCFEIINSSFQSFL